jgi:hypothetical protein
MFHNIYSRMIKVAVLMPNLLELSASGFRFSDDSGESVITPSSHEAR